MIQPLPAMCSEKMLLYDSSHQCWSKQTKIMRSITPFFILRNKEFLDLKLGYLIDQKLTENVH
jgi:hypothetical protein